MLLIKDQRVIKGVKRDSYKKKLGLAHFNIERTIRNGDRFSHTVHNQFLIIIVPNFNLVH